jgi:hypothetical protein
MTRKPRVMDDGRSVTVRVPISIRRRGGRKLVLAPDGAEVTAVPVTRNVDNAMVQAIARAIRWRDILESGERANIKEIAAAEKINESYVGRVLRLTLLAPEVVEATLDGRQLPELQLDGLLKPFPVHWEAQIEHFRSTARARLSSRGSTGLVASSSPFTTHWRPTAWIGRRWSTRSPI